MNFHKIKSTRNFANVYYNKLCKDISKAEISQKLRVSGWIKANRRLGHSIFLTLNDGTGIVQLNASLDNSSREYLD